jgi:hypothetical protein
LEWLALELVFGRAIVMDKKLDGGFDDVAVAEFRSATAGQFKVFATSGEGLELLKGFKYRTLGFVDLGG